MRLLTSNMHWVFTEGGFNSVIHCYNENELFFWL